MSANRAEWPARPLDYPPGDQLDGFGLRPWSIQDAPALAAAWSAPIIRLWLEPPAVDVASARKWIEGAEQRRHAGLALDLVVDVDGEVAGEVGFSSFDSNRRAALVGYWIAEGHQGCGLASRAVARACASFVKSTGAAAIVAECDAENLASHRTAINAGFALLDHDEARHAYVLRAC